MMLTYGKLANNRYLKIESQKCGVITLTNIEKSYDYKCIYFQNIVART